MKRLFIALAAFSFFACTAAAPAPEPPKAPAEVPITSKSTEAIDHFKKGRDLADNSRLAEAAQNFFATTYLFFADSARQARVTSERSC